MSKLAVAEANAPSQDETRDFLTIWIAGQIFGIPILQVQDVLAEQRVTRVPRAHPAVAGSLNLRGRIVTAINVRTCLGLPAVDPSSEAGPPAETMSVVVENQGELFSLVIDKVGDVMSLPDKDFDGNPGTLDPVWRNVSNGIYRLKENLLVVLDVPNLLGGIS